MKEAMTGIDLSALIGSRICHDLISPLGAIGNGVELLSMSGIGSTPEVALIAESVESANARIRFFRVAFGPAEQGVEIGQGEVQSILRETYKGGRTRLDWRVGGALPRADVKLGFLLLQCLENSLPLGGQIVIRRTGNDWSFEARGEKLKLDGRLWDMFADPGSATEVGAADVHFALVHDAARGAGRSVNSFLSETRVTVSF